METGDIISVKAEKPILHGGEDTRWDFKVTIEWKNAELGVGKEDFKLFLPHPFSVLIYI